MIKNNNNTKNILKPYLFYNFEILKRWRIFVGDYIFAKHFNVIRNCKHFKMSSNFQAIAKLFQNSHNIDIKYFLPNITNFITTLANYFNRLPEVRLKDSLS